MAELLREHPRIQHAHCSPMLTDGWNVRFRYYVKVMPAEVPNDNPLDDYQDVFGEGKPEVFTLKPEDFAISLPNLIEKKLRRIL